MDALSEKTLSTKDVYSGSFLKVKQDEVQGPDGKVYLREYIQHPGAALIIPLLDNNKVVMIRQYRHAVKKEFLEFPAGKRDAGEDLLITAQRELLEETGYTAKDWNFLTTIHPVIGYSDEHIDIYLAKDLTFSSVKLDAGEFLETVEVEIPKLLELIQGGHLSDVKTQIAAFWLDKIMRGSWNEQS